MTEEVSTVSPLEKQARNAGYYAALVFGAGYLLTFIGIIVVAIEVLIRALPYIGPYISTIPPWLIAGLICYLIAVIFGAILGGAIIRNAKSARDFDISLDTISSSVSAFSCMILFAGIGSIILINGISSISYPYGYYPTPGYYPIIGSSYLTYPIIEIVGAILLLIGFRAYRGKQSDSKLVGAILMLISVILIYIVAYAPLRDSYAVYSNILHTIGTVPYGTPIFLVSLPPLPGILLSEATLETVTLMIASICAILFAFLTREGEAKRSIVSVILSVGGILFSVGLLYFNFSTVSLLSKLLPYTGSMMATLWIMFLGFLILGISGIIILIAASLTIAVSVKQLSTQPPKPTVPPPPPPPPPT
ncbi:MAG: hypothetical protein QHH18_04085 [Candidatus Bathyarchaeota archaeon]|jgi:hypothetical protein|nr:hypothetical protein [Candidatus Bathyarchaeota archaeon A05DMB-5]MDH7557769.1 hypothetical protein [Candidatus Bathyarchaeota archaeon]